MKVRKIALVPSLLLAVALLLSLAAVPMPVTPAEANDEGNPVNRGNLEWAPLYLDGTHNKIALTNCPETVSFDWYQGGTEPELSRYAYEGDDHVCFTVTFKNLDTADHDLNFTWADGEIADVDWTITPDPVTIPASETADVTFCCDLSNTTTYPVFPWGDWHGWYRAKFDVGYDGLHATSMYLDVCVLPTDGSVPVVPTVFLQFVYISGGVFYANSMRFATYSEGLQTVNFGFSDFMYYCSIVDQVGVYDETAWVYVDWAAPDWEMNILDDGSVEIMARTSFTYGLSDVTWDRTWHLTHDAPYLQVTDVYTNTGTDPMSFSISNYLINPATEGAAIKVPGVHDGWTMFCAWDALHEQYYPTIPPIMADDMAAPVIFECDAAGVWSAEAPGAFGAVVFPTEVPYYNSTGAFPWWARRGTAFSIGNELIFSYRYDLAPGESKTLETYYVFTGSYPSSSYGPEEELYGVVYSLLSWPAPAISLSPDEGVGAFTIEGQGFTWDSEITITWDGTPIPGATSSDWAGEFSAVVSVPEQTEPGNHTVTASDGTNSASAIFTVPDMAGQAANMGWVYAALALAGIAIILSLFAMLKGHRQ